MGLSHRRRTTHGRKPNRPYSPVKGLRIPVLLETNGSLYDKKIFNSCDHISLDLKAPSSGNCVHSEDAFRFCLIHPKKTQIKVVVHDRRDLLFFREVHSYSPQYPFWVIQPEWSAVKDLNYQRIASEFPSVRIIPQMHKFLMLR